MGSDSEDQDHLSQFTSGKSENSGTVWGTYARRRSGDMSANKLGDDGGDVLVATELTRVSSLPPHAQGDALESLVKAHPKSQSALMALAQLSVQAGSFKHAEKILSKAARLSGDKSAEAYSQLGRIHAGQQQLDAAIACFEECIRLEPEAIQHHLSLGMALVATGKAYGALTVYHNALRADPENPQLIFHCAAVWHDLERFDQAIHQYKRVIDLVSGGRIDNLSNRSSSYNSSAKSLDAFLVPSLSTDRAHPSYSLLLDAQLNLAACFTEKGSAVPDYPSSSSGHAVTRRRPLKKTRMAADYGRAIEVYQALALDQLEAWQRAEVLQSIEFLKREIESLGE